MFSLSAFLSDVPDNTGWKAEILLFYTLVEMSWGLYYLQHIGRIASSWKSLETQSSSGPGKATIKLSGMSWTSHSTIVALKDHLAFLSLNQSKFTQTV